MSYRIPDDDTLADALFMVLHRHSPIRSQALLAELVSRELAREDPRYRASGERLRRLAVSRGLAELDISYRDAEGEDAPESCPVCRAKLKTVANRTLCGEDTVIGRRCRRCGFSMGLSRRVPAVYVFQQKSGR